MPTFETLPAFDAGWRSMTREQQTTFRQVVLESLVPGLASPGRAFEPGLRVRPLSGHPGLYEMSWGDAGRAAFSYGTERVPGEPHLIWWQITAAADLNDHGPAGGAPRGPGQTRAGDASDSSCSLIPYRA